ncbi:hypothetical protein RZS08_03235, partial [Arthrospira platensis SPKY1]|nr:hypothetical protein [Arthrospira platensis SPKY1]
GGGVGQRGVGGQHAARPGVARRRPARQPAGRCRRVLGRHQHHGRLPGAAAQQLAAGMPQQRRPVPPARGQRRQRLHAVAAERTQVARRQPGMGGHAVAQPGRGHVAEQQVAQVVAVEGA